MEFRSAQTIPLTHKAVYPQRELHKWTRSGDDGKVGKRIILEETKGRTDDGWDWH